MAAGDDLVIPGERELAAVERFQNVLGGAFGGGSGGGGGSFTPTAANPQLTAQDLNNLMTNFLRTDGQFLQRMYSAPQAGLYNSNTQRLMANDLLSQAALKATMGNVQIAESNARIAAANASGAAAAGKGGKGKDKWEARRNLALAGLLMTRNSPAWGNAWESTKEFFGGGSAAQIGMPSEVLADPLLTDADPLMQGIDTSQGAYWDSLRAGTLDTENFASMSNQFGGLSGLDIGGTIDPSVFGESIPEFIPSDVGFTDFGDTNYWSDLDWSGFEAGTDIASAY